MSLKHSTARICIPSIPNSSPGTFLLKSSRAMSQIVTSLCGMVRLVASLLALCTLASAGGCFSKGEMINSRRSSGCPHTPAPGGTLYKDLGFSSKKVMGSSLGYWFRLSIIVTCDGKNSYYEKDVDITGDYVFENKLFIRLFENSHCYKDFRLAVENVEDAPVTMIDMDWDWSTDAESSGRTFAMGAAAAAVSMVMFR